MNPTPEQLEAVHRCQQYVAFVREYPGATARDVATAHFGHDDRPAVQAAFDLLVELQQLGMLQRVRRHRRMSSKRNDAWIVTNPIDQAKLELLEF